MTDLEASRSTSAEHVQSLDIRTVRVSIAQFAVHDHRVFVRGLSGNLAHSCICVAYAQSCEIAMRYGASLGVESWEEDHEVNTLFRWTGTARLKGSA